MAIDYPNSPAIGDTFTSGTTTWAWDGTKWQPAPAGNWVEAPSDNRTYSRRNLAWTPAAIQFDAPTDGQAHRRIVSGGIMGWAPDPIRDDAPAAVGSYYGRVNGAWGALSPTFALKTYVDNQDAANLAAANALTAAIGVPIGGIVMYGNPTPPARFLNCDGTQYSYASVPQLANAIGGYFGGDWSTYLLVPNIGGRVPIGTSVGAVGGASSVSLGVGHLPPHQHLVPAHGHGFSDPGHNHGQSPHGHGVSDPGHAHSYNQWGAGGQPVYAQATYYQGNSNANTGGSGTGIGIQAQYANINAAGTGCGIQSNGPWGTDPSWGQGSATAFGIYPPYLGFNFIIRYY
jgi:microcystin-dependent protein